MAERGESEVPSPPAVREHLERVLESAAFRSSKRSREFLQFVVERTLTPGEPPLKERTIGVELFGRDAGYDTHEDAIVRVKANEIRKRLAQYYQTEGAAETLRIELEPGSYTPLFRGGAGSAGEVPHPAGPPPAGRKSRRWAVAGGLALVSALAVALLAPRGSPLEKFWGPMLKGEEPILFYMGESVTYQLSRRVQDEFLRRNPSYLKSLRTYALPLGPGFDIRPEDLILLRNVNVSTGDATTIANLGALFLVRGRRFEMKFGDVAPGVGGAPLVVLVGAFNNPWTIAATRDLRYHYMRDLTGEGALWGIQDRDSGRSWKLFNLQPLPNTSIDYALITRLLDARRGSMTVALGGLAQFGTEAAGQILSSAEGMEQIARLAPPGWESRNMQVVIQTEVAGMAAVSPKVLEVHVW